MAPFVGHQAQLALERGAARQTRKSDLAAAEGSEETLDRLEHRALEVEAARHLAGKLDRLPPEQADGAAAAQARVVAGHQAVGALGIPDEIDGGVWRPVGTFREQDPPHPSCAAGGIKPPDQIRRVGQRHALALIGHPVQRDERLDVVDRANNDLLFGLANVRAHRLAESIPNCVQIIEFLDYIRVPD